MPVPNLDHYVVITPARNEGNCIEHTIESMLTQSVRPRQWIIVDDGSTDQTGPRLHQLADDHDWVSAISRPDRGKRIAGAGVMEAFSCGYESIKDSDWEFLVKLDADLAFGEDYFATCLEHFRSDPKLGISGGTICVEREGELVPESNRDPAFHVRGATKIYRRSCWDQMGGLMPVTGWDTLDEIKANMLGWKTRTLSDLPVLHLRPTGAAAGAWRDWVKNGRANYIAGYHPLFMLCKCLRRALRKGSSQHAFGLLWGFTSGYLTGTRRIDDRQLIRYLRTQQRRALLLQPSIWSYDTPEAAR